MFSKVVVNGKWYGVHYQYRPELEDVIVRLDCGYAEPVFKALDLNPLGTFNDAFRISKGKQHYNEVMRSPTEFLVKLMAWTCKYKPGLLNGDRCKKLADISPQYKDSLPWLTMDLKQELFSYAKCYDSFLVKLDQLEETYK
jgi:hypothetical protein